MFDKVISPKVVVNKYPNDPCYKPSVISPCLCSVDEDNCVHLYNDVHVILREKNFAKKVGEDVAQSYVNDLARNRYLPEESSSLNDDQIFSTIPSRRVVDKTDVYLETKNMESDLEYIKSQKSKSEKSKGELKKLKEEIFGKKDTDK